MTDAGRPRYDAAANYRALHAEVRRLREGIRAALGCHTEQALRATLRELLDGDAESDAVPADRQETSPT